MIPSRATQRSWLKARTPAEEILACCSASACVILQYCARRGMKVTSLARERGSKPKRAGIKGKDLARQPFRCGHHRAGLDRTT